MKKLKVLLVLFYLLFITTSLAQNIDECGLDTNFKLTKQESDYLNEYLKDKRNGFDFTDKKIIIVTGNTGQNIGSKKKYFADIKSWLEDGHQIATTLIVFTEDEKLKSGCDGILTLWVKVLTKRGKRKIIAKAKNY